MEVGTGMQVNIYLGRDRKVGRKTCRQIGSEDR